MNVAVTGGSGHLGRHVVKLLVEKGHQVTNLDRERPEDWRLSRFIRLNLADAAEVFDALAMVKPEGVVHLAANPQPMGNPRHPLFMQNVGISHAVMQAAGDLGVRRIVYASSEQASGWTSQHQAPRRIPMDEAAMVPPTSAYALSKLVGEVIAESMVATYPEMSAVSLRLNYVFAPDQYERMRKWQGNVDYPSPNFWSYIDARDAAEAFRLALEADTPGHRTYSIAATDTFIDVPTRDAMTRHHGDGLEFADDLPEFGSAIDCRRIEEDLGWRPQWSWRDVMGGLEGSD
jgi:nucleoside-diphosphate-sugar epimerase